MPDQKVEDLRKKNRDAFWLRLILIIALLVPIVATFLFPPRLLPGLFWFWFLLLVSFWVVWLVISRYAQKTADEAEPEIHTLAEEPEPVRELMDVQLAEE